MAKYEVIEVEELPYLYEERSCGMDPQDISAAMGTVFGEVYAYALEQGLTSVKEAVAVYYTYDPKQMTFRAGYLVSPEDATKTNGVVKAEVLPAGEVLHFTHIGPYAKLRDSYGEMMAYLEKIGREVDVPTWEVYVNDPNSGIPESQLRTEVYVTLA